MRPDLLDLINQARSQAQLCGDTLLPAAGPVEWDDALALAAVDHSQDGAHNAFRGHTGSDGSTLRDRVRTHTGRFSVMTENIAYFQRTAEGAVRGWVTSPKHCRNLMDRRMTHLGGAVTRGARFDGWPGHGHYWVVVLAGESLEDA